MEQDGFRSQRAGSDISDSDGIVITTPKQDSPPVRAFGCVVDSSSNESRYAEYIQGHLLGIDCVEKY